MNMHEPLPCGRADASPAGNDKCISRTPSAAVSEAETTLGTVSRESSPMLERGPRLDEAMAGDHGTMWERIAATWMLCAWLLPGYASSLLPDFSVASAPVSDKQGQPREESTLIERLTATWVLLAWLGYLPAVDMGFQDDTTSERITFWERASASWALITWLGYGPASIACSACFLMLTCAVLAV